MEILKTAVILRNLSNFCDPLKSIKNKLNVLNLLFDMHIILVIYSYLII